MSDFYALLKQSIIERGIRSAAERAAIYAQARQAIIAQLWDYHPPLAEDEIDTRVGSFDTAVERIEAELAERFADEDEFVPEPERERNRRSARSDVDDEIGFSTRGWSADEAGSGGRANLPSPYAPKGRRREEPPRRAHRGDDGYIDEDAVPVPLAYEAAGDEEDDEAFDAWHDEDDEAPDTGTRYFRRAPRVSDWVTDWLGTGEQRTVRLLATAIGALLVILAGFGTWVLAVRSHPDFTVATQTTSTGREVADESTAARIPTESLTVTQSYDVFDGKNPSVFQSIPDNPIRFDSDAGYARVGTSASASGVKVAIGPGLAIRLAGRRVRIVVTVRSSTDQGAAGMRFAYQSGLALSYWQRANLDNDFKQVGMIWRLPAQRTSSGDDYLLIQPGIPGDGTGADIKSIRIDVLAS